MPVAGSPPRSQMTLHGLHIAQPLISQTAIRPSSPPVNTSVRPSSPPIHTSVRQLTNPPIQPISPASQTSDYSSNQVHLYFIYNILYVSTFWFLMGFPVHCKRPWKYFFQMGNLCSRV